MSFDRRPMLEILLVIKVFINSKILFNQCLKTIEFLIVLILQILTQVFKYSNTKVVKYFKCLKT